MKNLIKIFASVALLYSMTSCNQDNEGNIYNPQTDQVSFYSNILNYGLTPAQNNVLTLPVVRTQKGAAAALGEFALDSVYRVVNGKGTNVSSQNLFVLKSSQASFADGAGEGAIQFSYTDINALDASSVYKLYVSNKSKDISPTLIPQVVVSAQRVLTYTMMEGKAKVTSTWGNAVGQAQWETDIEKANEAEFYKLKDFYTKGGDITFSVGADGSVSVARQKDGEVHSSYGDIYVETDSAKPSKKEGKVVTLYLKMTVSAGSFGTFKEIVVLP
ncbi:MAG: hypothetical protein ACRC77_10900 [Bacteroidales bacterium]